MSIEAGGHLLDFIRQNRPGPVNLASSHRRVEGFGIQKVGTHKTGKNHSPEKRDLEPAILECCLKPGGKKSYQIGFDLVLPNRVERRNGLLKSVCQRAGFAICAY